MRHQPVSVHQKLVALGFATENRVIVEHQATLAETRALFKNQCPRQPTDTAAHHHTVVSLTRLDQVPSRVFEPAIANPVPRFQNCERITVGLGVVANATVTGPFIAAGTGVRIRSQ